MARYSGRGLWGLVSRHVSSARLSRHARLRFRQLPDRGGHIRPRGKRRHQVLDGALALVARRIEDLTLILRRQVRGQQPDGGQRQSSLSQQIEQDGKAPRGARCLDTAVRRVFGEVQDFGAVGEE